MQLEEPSAVSYLQLHQAPGPKPAPFEDFCPIPGVCASPFALLGEGDPPFIPPVSNPVCAVMPLRAVSAFPHAGGGCGAPPEGSVQQGLRGQLEGTAWGEMSHSHPALLLGTFMDHGHHGVKAGLLRPQLSPSCYSKSS